MFACAHEDTRQTTCDENSDGTAARAGSASILSFGSASWPSRRSACGCTVNKTLRDRPGGDAFEARNTSGLSFDVARKADGVGGCTRWRNRCRPSSGAVSYVSRRLSANASWTHALAWPQCAAHAAHAAQADRAHSIASLS